MISLMGWLAVRRGTNVEAQQPEPRKAGRIASLDGLRAIAVTAVIIAHVLSNHVYLGNWEFQFSEGLGFLGVDLFFVISGFIITLLLLREKERLGQIYLPRFYARRALRLWPPLWVFMAVVVLLGGEKDVAIHLKGVISPLLFMSDYVIDHHSVVTTHTWSLSVEEQFYLLWPIFVVRLSKGGLRRILVAAIIAAPLVRIASYILIPEWRTAAFFQFHDRYDMLAAGCLLALCKDDIRAQRLFRCQPAVLACVCGLSALSVNAVDAGLPSRTFLFTVGYGIQAITLAILVGVCVSDPPVRLGRFLNSRSMIHIGTISYALYLWQQLFIVTPFPPFRFIPLGILGAVVCAEVSWRVIEKPMQKWRAALHPR
jgi:peptidoglycan/LPS O-acetylase OafA/YrhL